MELVATVIFFRKQCISLQNVCRGMEFTHIFGNFIHTFSPKLLNFYIVKPKSFIMKFMPFYYLRKWSQFMYFQCVKFLAQKSSCVEFLTIFMSSTENFGLSGPKINLCLKRTRGRQLTKYTMRDSLKESHTVYQNCEFCLKQNTALLSHVSQLVTMSQA